MPDYAFDPVHLLADWQHFLTHGFRQEDFTPALHHVLTAHFPLEAPGHTPDDFWRYFFAADLGRLQKFLDVVAGPDPPRARLEDNHPRREAVRETLRTLKPTLTRTLTDLAHDLYQAEKADLLNHPTLNANPDRLDHWSSAYDAHFPFDEHTPYLQVTPRVRQLLGQVTRQRLYSPRQTTIFAAHPAAVGQAARLSPPIISQYLFHHLGDEADTDDSRRRRLAAPADEEQRQQTILSVRRRHLESHR